MSKRRAVQTRRAVRSEPTSAERRDGVPIRATKALSDTPGSHVRRSVLYAAKSNEDKRGSIEIQIADCRAEAEGEEVAEVYTDEGFSAYYGNRGDGLADAQAHCERLADEGIEGTLRAQHSDRLARGNVKRARHLVEIALWAMKAGVRVRCVHDPQTFESLLQAVVTGDRNFEDSD